MNEAKRPAPASDYDEFVDWDKRLAREAPLFRRVFDEAGRERSWTWAPEAPGTRSCSPRGAST